MKKIVFFLPAIGHMLFFGFICLGIGLSASPVIAYGWMGAYVIGGVILSKGWGGFIGMLPGIHSIYMSMQDTGQVLPIELPLGLVVVLFYAACGAVLLYKKKRKSARA